MEEEEEERRRLNSSNSSREGRRRGMGMRGSGMVEVGEVGLDISREGGV